MSQYHKATFIQNLLGKIQQEHIGDGFVKFVKSRKVRGFGGKTV